MDNLGFQPDAEAALPNNLRNPIPADDRRNRKNSLRQQQQQQQQQRVFSVSCRALDSPIPLSLNLTAPVHNNNAGEGKASAVRGLEPGPAAVGAPGAGVGVRANAVVAAATAAGWPRGRGLVRLGPRRWELRLASPDSPRPSPCSRPWPWPWLWPWPWPFCRPSLPRLCPGALLLGLLLATAAALALAAVAVVLASTVLSSSPDSLSPAVLVTDRGSLTTTAASTSTSLADADVSGDDSTQQVAVYGEFKLQLPMHQAPHVSADVVNEVLTLVFRGFEGFLSATSALESPNDARATSTSSPSSTSSSSSHSSPTVRCVLRFVDAVPSTLAPRVGLHFLGSLRPAAGRLWLAGRLPVDPRSVTFGAAPFSTDHRHHHDHDHDHNQEGDRDLSPAWSEWSSWSACGSSSSQQRTRVCRTQAGLGERAPDSEPCLLAPGGGGGDLEVRDCRHPDARDATVDALLGGATQDAETLPHLQRLTEASYMAVAPILPTPKEDALEADADTETNGAKGLQEPLPPIPALSLTLGPRRCDACLPEEVCVALAGESLPACRTPMDTADPTGCGGLCRLNRDLCYRLDIDAFRCMEDSPCLTEEWRCGNQLCIPHDKRCDGHLNCYDHTDELDCDCDLLTHFQCGNFTSCLPRSKRCDRIIDCWDGSDELNCTQACPRADQFTCSDGQCIPRVHFCDGLADCHDISDEPFGCRGACKRHEWRCGNGRCVKKAAVCDGHNDCGDETDEANCPPGRVRPRVENSTESGIS